MVYVNALLVNILFVATVFVGVGIGAAFAAIAYDKKVDARLAEKEKECAKLKEDNDAMYNALADIKLVYDRGLGIGMQAVIDRAIVVYKKIRGA